MNVESLSQGYQDTHFVQAKPSLMVTMHKADLLIYQGMELEVGWLPLAHGVPANGLDLPRWSLADPDG